MKFENIDQLKKAVAEHGEKSSSAKLADSGKAKSLSEDFGAKVTGHGYDNLTPKERADLLCKTIGVAMVTGGNTEKGVELAKRINDPLLEKALSGCQKGLHNMAGERGGFFIEENVSRGMLDLLRSETVIRQAGVKVLSGPNYTYNYKTVGTTAHFTGECQDPIESEMKFGQASLAVKKLQAKISICEDLIWNTPHMEWGSIIAGDFTEQIKQKEDIAMIRGSGEGASVKGLLNLCLPSNKFFTGSAAFLSPANKLQELVNDAARCRALLASRNVPSRNRGWIMHPSVKIALESILNSDGKPVWADELSRNMWYGEPVYTTTAIPTDLATARPASDADYAAAVAAGNIFTEIYYVDFSSLMILQGPVGNSNSMVMIQDLGRDPNCDSELRYRAVTKFDFGVERGGIEMAVIQDVDLSAFN